MALDKFLIGGPFSSGLVTDTRPWLIPDEAFAELRNAYVYHNRVRKRYGTRLLNELQPLAQQQLFSRLRINIGTTAAGTGNFPATIVPGATVAGRTGILFSIGTTVFTVNVVGNPAAMLTTGVATGTFDTTTGQVTITGNAENPATAIYYYPALPVMGLLTYETSPVNNEPTFGFDTQFAYQRLAGAWELLGPIPPAAGSGLWTGSDSQFFWSSTSRGLNAFDRFFFVTNFQDPIRYWNGAIWTTPVLQYNANALETIQTSRIIVSFKGRLLLLNTQERNAAGATNAFTNRCRYSQIGDPVGATAWREDIPGRGGFIDATTREGIVSADFLKDRLIVFFERSTWELAYTGNEILPFRWLKINTELGAESPNSIVPFDRVVLGVGNVGIHACNGVNVERIDEKIEDEVFKIHNGSEGVFRVYGIRDYNVELVYWTFPSAQDNPTFPNQVLIFNYRTGSWALNDDTITAFGYFQQDDDRTWAASTFQWQQAVDTWNAGALQSRFMDVIAGNQQGWTYIIDPDRSSNSPSLQITSLVIVDPNNITLTVINHNLRPALDWILIEFANGVNGVNDVIFNVVLVVDANTITIQDPTGGGSFNGAYRGNGIIRRISQISIKTKQYNFYASKGSNAFIQRVEFLVDHTSHGQIEVEYFTSSSEVGMVDQALVSGSILGTSILETFPFPLRPFEIVQTRLWHPIYLQADGETIQLHLFLNGTQLSNRNIAFSDFELHAMVFYTQPTSRLE